MALGTGHSSLSHEIYLCLFLCFSVSRSARLLVLVSLTPFYPNTTTLV
ncbi:hypothetical protein S7335_489 [Synechococcus sp. PCC 7335]|nr:hypothetical protein S7335_489 [Synechococcus sp. PCC 7335]